MASQEEMMMSASEKQQGGHDHHHINDESESRNRLPTLLEVLNRKTLPPVDLFSFYIYMRDQQQSVDYLDFWLDVSQHMSLCRLYVRQLRRSVLLGTPDPTEKTGHDASSNEGDTSALHSSSALNLNFNDTTEPTPSQGSSEPNNKRVSAVLRAETEINNFNGSPSHNNSQRSDGSRSPSNEHENENENEEYQPQRSDEQLSQAGESTSPSQRNGERGSVSRADLSASAERILYTYLLPDSEREVVLPEPLVESVLHMVEEERRDDPEVFDAAKDYVFQAMERDAFPGFLQSKALGNLVPTSIFIRLVLALLGFFGGFWAAFYCVLSDQARHTRCWVILPFVFAAYFAASYQYKLDPVAAWFGVSEYTFMNWVKIREPFVRRLLFKRAWADFILAAAIAISLSVLFIFVPGHHL